MKELKNMGYRSLYIELLMRQQVQVHKPLLIFYKALQAWSLFQ